MERTPASLLVVQQKSYIFFSIPPPPNSFWTNNCGQVKPEPNAAESQQQPDSKDVSMGRVTGRLFSEYSWDFSPPKEYEKMNAG